MSTTHTDDLPPETAPTPLTHLATLLQNPEFRQVYFEEALGVDIMEALCGQLETMPFDVSGWADRLGWDVSQLRSILGGAPVSLQQVAAMAYTLECRCEVSVVPHDKTPAPAANAEQP